MMQWKVSKIDEIQQKFIRSLIKYRGFGIEVSQ